MNLSAAEVYEVRFLGINASVASSPRFASLNIIDTSGSYAELNLTPQSPDVYSVSATAIPPGLVDLSDVDVLFFELDVIANSDVAVAIDVIRVSEPTSSVFAAWIALGTLLWLARRRSHRS
jgi:hypothetical protein